MYNITDFFQQCLQDEWNSCDTKEQRIRFVDRFMFQYMECMTAEKYVCYKKVKYYVEEILENILNMDNNVFHQCVLNSIDYDQLRDFISECKDELDSYDEEDEVEDSMAKISSSVASVIL